MGDETDRIRLKLATRRWGLRRVAVSLIGFTVLLLGLALVLLPGPGLLIVAFGFAILATEFVWAWRAKRYVERKARHAASRALRRHDDRSLTPRRPRDRDLPTDPFPR